MNSKPTIMVSETLQAVILGVAIVVGAISTYVSYVQPLTESLVELGPRSERERAAVLMEGERFAEFVAFIRANTSEDARIILPPNFPQQPVAHIGLMQYFLYPRDIHNCGVNEVEECVMRVTGENTYILAVGGFPPPGIAELHKDLIPFDDTRGLYAPSAPTNQDQGGEE